MVTCPKCNSLASCFRKDILMPEHDKFICRSCHHVFSRYQYTEYGWDNYVDAKCSYGYMTICAECVNGPNVPKHIDTNRTADRSLPHPKCELCKKKLK